MGNGRHSALNRNRNSLHRTTRDILGEAGKRISRADMIERTNPHYGEGVKYKENCALCVVATALQYMGYDVEALGRDKKWRGFSNVFDYEFTPENFKAPIDKFTNYTGVPWEKSFMNTNKFTEPSVDSMSSEIRQQMIAWDDASYESLACINVAWTEGGAHTLIVHHSAITGTEFWDTQTHTVYSSPESWFDAHPNANLKSIGLYRLNNVKIKSSKIASLDKMIKRRSR